MKILKLKYKFALVISLFACYQTATAQHCKFYTVSYKDSLVGTRSEKILMNNIVIENPNNKTMRLGYSVLIPACWKPLSGGKNYIANINLILSPFEKRVIPINLLKLPSAIAQWDSIRIRVWMQSMPDTHTYYCHLNVEPMPAYVVRNFTNAINIESEKATQALVSVYVRNSGNISDSYKLFWVNSHLNINDSVAVTLKPGQDSIIYHAIKFKSWKLKDIQNERLALTINNTYGDTRNLYCNINNPQSRIIEHQSAYKTIPLFLEIGAMTMGDGMAYYGAVKGQIMLGREHFVDFSYRSNQMGNFINQYQPNVFNINYHNRSFDVYAGQLSGPLGFYVFGNGVGVKYKSKKGNEYSITGIKHIDLPYNTVANSDNIAASAIYSIGKMKFTNLFTINSDVKYHINSYLVTKSIDLINKKGLLVNVNGGAGIEKKTKDVVGLDRYSDGFAGGYLMSLTKKHWSTRSMISYYSPNYPGTFRGAQMQSHDLQWLTKHTGIGGFYTSNAMEANYLRDTLYNSDYLSYNVKKYGVMFNLFNKSKTSALSLRIGKLTQNGQQGMYDRNGMNSVDMMYNMQYRKLNINAFSQNAFTEDVLLSNNSLMFSGGLLGFNASYNRTPGYSTDGQPVTMESVNGGPNVNFSLFRRALNGSVRYNVSKLLGDDSYTSGVGGNLAYSNRKLGLQIMANLFYSFSKSANPNTPIMFSRFATFSIAKNFNAPILRSKKYYDLKVILFKDANGNGQKDEGEELLEDAMVYVQEFNLVTNRFGEIDCRNMPSGTYKINLVNTRKAKLIATNGPIQTIILSEDTKVYIPFKEGRSLKGKVSIELDSLSTSKFSAEFLRIVITDSLNHTYSALSNAEGEFAIALPDGTYKVSLNPALLEMEGFKPDEMSYDVDLTVQESEFVQFTIKQKKRKVKVLGTK